MFTGETTAPIFVNWHDWIARRPTKKECKEDGGELISNTLVTISRRFDDSKFYVVPPTVSTVDLPLSIRV